jgi:hypothetical protein
MDAVDLAALAQDGAERKGHIHFLFRELAVEEHEDVLGPGGLPGIPDALEHGTDRVPDVVPGLPPGTTQDARMLGVAQERDVGVVVEDREGGTPPHEHRKG